MANESSGDNEASPGNPYARAFSNRGPNKRKVKPSCQSQLLQFAMFSDSEDDEDFVAGSDDDDYSTDNSGDGQENEHDANEASTKEPSTPKLDSPSPKVKMEPNVIEVKGTDEVEKGDESEDGDYAPVSDESAKSSNESDEPEEDSGDEIYQPDEDTEKGAEETFTTPNDVSTMPKKKEKLVCGICLESESTEEDELVECDWCGITVHEGCYGDAEESVSEDKSDSDAETEPWFCDSCKAKCEGHCELCPIKGGILKQTVHGLWVHLICALYVPAVGFRDVDRLKDVVIDDVSSSQWGSRRCILCEDQRFSKTGICIQCDAGMCKMYFHAMCAQKHGLLTEVPAAGHLNDDDVDPLFAHCKLHTDKAILRSRIKRYTAFDAHFKNFKRTVDAEGSRIEDAYQRARSEYLDFKSNNPPAVVQIIDQPRLMTSCPELCLKLLKKAELDGYSTHAQEITMNNSAYVRAFRPSLSSDFVNHFFKRETLISKYQSEEQPLLQKIKKNKDEQIALQDSYSILKLDLENAKSKRADLYSKVSKLNSSLEKILGKKVVLPSYIAKPKKKQRKDSEINIDALIHSCETCKGTENQHLMALCDTCQNYYHIGCLDPPLLTLPKKSRKWLWQCTECDQSGSSSESVDTEEGLSMRKRKRKTNIPKKFTPIEENTTSSKVRGRHKGKGSGKVGRPKKQINYSKSNEEKIEPPEIVVEKKPAEKGRRGKKRKPQVLFEPCIVCFEDGDHKNMVKCDECSNCYHFHCCEPKLKSNPKKRGYMWYCIDCGESNEEDEDEEDKGNEDNGEGFGDDADVIEITEENGIYESS